MRRSENVKRQGMRIAFSCRTVRTKTARPRLPACRPFPAPRRRVQALTAAPSTLSAAAPAMVRHRPPLARKPPRPAPSATAKMMEAPIAPITPPARLVSRCARARAAPITLVSAAMWVIPSMNRMAMSVV